MEVPDRNRLVTLVTVGLVLAAAGLWATSPAGPLGGLLHPLDYERASVTAVDENGSTLATVSVRIADSERERHVGLSETDSLGEDEGMLFVHDSPGRYAYVMETVDTMAFPLDIVFVAPNGTITTIRHAPVPANADGDRRYRGWGEFVLEVPRGYTNATGIDVGDRIRLPGDVQR